MRDEIVLFFIIFCNPAPQGCGLNCIVSYSVMSPEDCVIGPYFSFSFLTFYLFMYSVFNLFTIIQNLVLKSSKFQKNLREMALTASISCSITCEPSDGTPFLHCFMLFQLHKWTLPVRYWIFKEILDARISIYCSFRHIFSLAHPIAEAYIPRSDDFSIFEPDVKALRCARHFRDTDAGGV